MVIEEPMNSKKKSILIVIIAGIGDLVLASKSIRAIRNGYPNANIHLLTSTEAAPIAHNYDYVDHVWDFPVRDLRKNKLKIFDILNLIQKLRKTDFSMAVNLYRVSSSMGAIKMALFFLLLKARMKIGHDHLGFGVLMDKKAPKDTFQNQHFVDAMMDMALLAEGIQDNKNIEVFWDKKSEEKWDHILLEDRNEVIKIGINPADMFFRGKQQRQRSTIHPYIDQHRFPFNIQVVLAFGKDFFDHIKTLRAFRERYINSLG